ncbi:NUDIX hydrolase [Pararhodobacter sp. SW119]|uniref:NUDIX hydrolase n=1 Tax=Pararhodobacter sp. SW119 TaxID=2780075 RepID=UPI001ADEE533|nr:NUDIX hydrolase [Pararhodobacter sp. SW119]
MSDAPPAPDKAALRDAATIVLVRDAQTSDPKVLMGQRGAGAVFMPNKFVFPGGALDPDDSRITLDHPLEPAMHRQLAAMPVTDAAPRPEAMVAAAIRELWEEAGLMLARPGAWDGPLPQDWRAFAEMGMRPSPRGLRYIFRAITPAGRPRRFDARFFLADAATIDADLDDFGRACDELSHLHWIEIAEARRLDLPFITEVVLAEAEEVLRRGLPESVPFFDNSGPVSTFRRIA